MSAAAVAGRHAANDGSFRRSVLLAAGRAALLVAVAVILGVYILQATDHGSKKPKVAAGSKSTTSTRPLAHAVVSSTRPSTTTSTTTAAVRKPADLTVIVVNATGRNGAAASFSTTVGAKGYKMLAPGTARAVQKATLVYFRPGLQREAQALASAIGNNATATPMPTPAPPSVPANAELAIILGSDAK